MLQRLVQQTGCCSWLEHKRADQIITELIGTNRNRSVRLDRAGYKYSEKGRSYPMDRPLPLLCIRENFVDECSVHRLCAADSRYLGLREVV